MSSPAAPAGKRLAIVVTGSAGPEDLLNQVLESRGFAPVVFVANVGELTSMMRARVPALVVVPVPQAGTGGDLSLFEAELRRNPGTAAIGTAAHKDADTVLAAMRAGIPEFVVTPIDGGEFTAAVSRVLSNLASPLDAGRVFTVYSAKGGVGTSTIATALAWALAQLDTERDSALVDFNTAGAGIRVMLNLNPTYDMGSVAARSDRLDRDYMRSVMTQHTDRVSVLSAAEELDAAESLDIKATGKLIELLRHEYSNTVIDTDHHFADQTLAALDAADRILLVTQLDVSALRSTQRSLGLFARLGYPAEKIMLVANRQNDRDRTAVITVAGAERVLGRKINFSIPNDYASCSGAITQGQFIQRYAATSPIVGAYRTIAMALAGQRSDSNGASPERSRFARMFSRKS